MNIFVIAIATTGTLILSRIASATELPSYEAMGYPITPHQISVLGSGKVKEQSPSTYKSLASQLSRASTASNYGDALKSI